MFPEVSERDFILPPKDAEAHVTSAIARQGMIGQCLQGALHDVMAEEEAEVAAAADTAADENDSMEDSSSKITAAKPPAKMMPLDSHVCERVMVEFGQAVARTKHRPNTASPKETEEKSAPTITRHNETTPSSSSSVLPPAALLRGRMAHYNRFHGKWRIVVEGAQLKRRMPLPKLRRKNIKPQLWDITIDPQMVTLPESVQILAYDDLGS